MLTEDQAWWFLLALIVATWVVFYVQFGVWGVVQVTAAGAVLFANIYYGWIDNGYAIGVVALLVSLAVTVIPLELWGLANRLWRRIRGGPQRRALGLGGKQSFIDRFDDGRSPPAHGSKRFGEP
jgi:hypothetical protein